MPLFNTGPFKKMAKVLLLAALGFFLCGYLSAGAATGNGQTANGQGGGHKNLRIALDQFPSTLHPFYDGMVSRDYVLGMSLRSVTAYDAQWRPICVLCTVLPSFENHLAKKETLPNGKHGIAATYTIQPKAAWGDGVPVTTKDILFAWEVGKNPKSGVDDADLFAMDIADIRSVDDKTFTIHFARETCNFASIVDFYALPEHLERKIFEQDPATYKNRTLYNTDPANPGLYWGPYKVSKLDAGAAITLDRNPHWYGAKPAFDTVALRFIENSAALPASLISGDIDYIAGETSLSLDKALQLQKVLPNTYQIIFKPGLTYEHIDLNLDQPAFKDLRVRQALMYAMDRDSINKTLFGGLQPPAATFVNPLDTTYDKDVRRYAYDPVKAAQLLEDAGWKKAADGIRTNAAGQKLAFTLSTTAGNAGRELIETAIQSDWKKMGIDVKIDNQPPRVLFGDTTQKRQFTGGVLYAWESAPGASAKAFLHSSSIPTAANSYAGSNFSGYNNPKTDKIIEEAETVCAPRDSQQLWNQLQNVYADELPALPLYFVVDSYFIPQWLTGLVPTGHMNPSTMWIENWKVAE